LQRMIIQVEDLLAIAFRSLMVSGAAVAASALIGVPLGVVLGLARFQGKSLLVAIVQTGMAFPPVVVGLAIYLLLSRSGPLGDLGWLFTPQAMILAQTILALPFVLGITIHAVESLPSGLAVQIRSLGATEWQLRWSLIREARSGILLAIASAFGRSISEVGAVLLVGGNIQGHTRVLTTAIILETSKGEFGLAIGLGIILLAIALATNFLMIRWIGQRPV
jgi:tungstate transport system permease protein